MEKAIKKAEVLIEALPYIKKFRGSTFVIKYGGSILTEESIRKSVLEDIVFLYFMGISVVLVHGGGPNITERFKSLNIKSEFHQGVRVTNKEALGLVEAELIKLNQVVAKNIELLGAKAIGLNGSEDLIYADQRKAEVDLGYVGQVTDINLSKFNRLIKKNHIVIIAPMGIGRNGEIYNINADEVASFVSWKLNAEKLVLLTDVKGVMRNTTDEESLISSITELEIKKLIKQKVISSGMIPKVLSGISALDQGTKKVHIINAKISHALLLEIFTDKGVGTEIAR